MILVICIHVQVQFTTVNYFLFAASKFGDFKRLSNFAMLQFRAFNAILFPWVFLEERKSSLWRAYSFLYRLGTKSKKMSSVAGLGRKILLLSCVIYISCDVCYSGKS